MPFLGPVIAGVGSVLTGAFSFLSGSTILAGALKIGLGLAAQWAVGQLFAPDVPAQVSHLETQYGQDLPRSVVLGTRGLAGHHIYRNAYGKGGRTVQDLYVLSHFRIFGVPRVRYEGKWYSLGGAVDAERGQRIQGIEPEIWVKVYQGDLAQAADAGLIARSNPPGRWTSAHRLAGVAYAVVTQQLDREKLPQAWQGFFEVTGLAYDWRQDSSAGGSGAQRWIDPTTWGPSNNPVVHQYNLERGFWLNGQLLVGKGISTDRLPIGKWTLAANICDEDVGGGARYKSAYIATAGQGITHAGNMAPLQAACASSWYEGPDGEYPIAGANQAVVATITDDDILPSIDKSFSRYRTRSELVNTIAGTYASPDAFYDSVPLATRTDAPAFIADRERLATSIPYDAVTDPKVGDRLNDIALRASRYQANAEICLRQSFLKLKVGNWIRWQSTDANGYAFDKTFQIVRRRLGPIGPEACRAVYVTLQEVGTGIFDPTAYQTNPPDATGPGAPDYQSELENFNLLPIKFSASTGSERAGIRASWNPIEDQTITEIRFEYGPVALTGQVPDRTASATALKNQTIQDLFEGVMSNSLWAVRYTLRSQPARTFFATPWKYVTTLPAKLGDDDVYLPGMVEQINQNVGNMLPPLQEDIRTIIERENKSSQQALEQDAGQFRNKQSQITQVKAAYETVTAEYKSVVLAATGPGSAIVQRLDTYDAKIADKASVSALVSIGLVATDVNGVITGTGTIIQGVQASVAGMSAQGLFRTYVTATETGAEATVGLAASSTANGATRSAAILLSSRSDGKTMAGLVADLIYFTDGSGNKQFPFVFSGGVMRANFANIGTITAGYIQSPDGLHVYNVAAGTQEWWRP
ncbi:hypothetical protein [Mesorhizobium amorphae]|uniref:hypothetical protein n=1 Tax=Mesorhizobium amorphae TaxID=71433 RepID=UPI001183A8F3|nr:hypothetical protein [Mesorhizobium amorphae]